MHYWFLDVILLVVITVIVWISMKKGFLKASYHALATIITILLVFAFQMPFQEYLEQSSLGDLVQEKVSLSVRTSMEENPEVKNAQSDESGLEAAANALPLPDFLHNFLNQMIRQQSENFETLKISVADSLTDMVSSVILQLVSIVLLFLLVRLGLYLLFLLLQSMAKLPVLRFFNKALGIVMGAVNALLAVYLVCTLVMLLTPVKSAEHLNEVINQTYLVKYFYQNNLLMTIFLN